MSFFPDLSECGLKFMHFKLHLPDGFSAISSFWEKKKFDSSQDPLALLEYSRLGHSHTSFIHWKKSNETCCDVTFGLELGPPNETFPRITIAKHRIHQADYKSFLEMVRTTYPKDTHIYASYGLLMAKPLINPAFIGPQISLKEAAFGVQDEQGREMLTFRTYKIVDQWMVILQPSGAISFLDQPVSDEFFRLQFNTACRLANSIQRGEDDG